MSSTRPEYLLAGTPAEVQRLQVQARAWEPEVETMLNEMGVERGWRCIDAGCGPMGIIGPLARRAGPAGVVVALDNHPLQLSAARQYAEFEGFGNVEFQEADLFTADVPAGSFDLVHARFVLTPVGREQEVLDRLTYLVRKGGLISLEEADLTPWTCDPPSSSWDCLKRSVLKSFERRGGNFSAAVRLGSLLQAGRLGAVRVREATLTLPGRHPYSRLIVDLAYALRPKIVSGGLLTESTLQDAMRTVEEVLASPYTFTQTFRLVQAWGRTLQQPARAMF